MRHRAALAEDGVPRQRILHERDVVMVEVLDELVGVRVVAHGAHPSDGAGVAQRSELVGRHAEQSAIDLFIVRASAGPGQRTEPGDADSRGTAAGMRTGPSTGCSTVTIASRSL